MVVLLQLFISTIIYIAILLGFDYIFSNIDIPDILVICTFGFILLFTIGAKILADYDDFKIKRNRK